MASKHAETQVKVTADTKEFNSKVKESKQNFQDFAKVSGQVSSKIGGALGVPIDKINQMSGALRGLGQKLEQTGGAGSQAFANILKSIGPVSVGIAGLGIGAAVSAFKLLNSEAEAFKNTIQGANIELAVKTYANTYRQVMRDSRQELGKGAADLQSQFKKVIATAGVNLESMFANAFAGKGRVDIVSGLFTGGNTQAWAEAAAKATAAEQTQEKIYQLQVRATEEARKRAELEAQIADYRRTAYDKNNDLSTREEALKRVQELMAAVYGGSSQYSYSYMDVASSKEVEGTLLGLTNIEREMSRLKDELANYASSDLATVNAAAQQYQTALSTVKQEQDRKRELLEIEQQLINLRKANAKSAAEAAAAAAEEAAAARKVKESYEAMKSQDLRVSDLSMPSTLNNAATDVGSAYLTRTFGPTAWEDFAKSVDAGFIKTFSGLKIGIGVELDKDQVVEFTTQLNSLISSSVESLGSTIGQLLGDLATGGDVWENFRNSAVSAFGDMAIAVGKIAVEAGVATLGLKAAFESLNPYVAMAAGAALIALGTAVKAGLSNVANGNYSSSSATSSVASSSYGSSSAANDWAQSEVSVKVTGTLQASGSALVAVLNNEEKRKSHTT